MNRLFKWLRKEVPDQLAHGAVGAAILLPLVLMPSFYALVWGFFACGWLREITEEGTPVTPAKALKALSSVTDLLGWTLWGVVAAVALFGWPL